MSNNNNNITRIKSVGGSLDLDIVVALTDKQINDMRFNFNSISTIKDLQPYLTPPTTPLSIQQQQSNNNTQLSNNTNNTCSLYPYVSLTSSNFLINSLLYINKVSKTKCFIEYIIPFSCAYNDDVQFLREFMENITAKNLILIEEHNLLNITPHITFTLKRVNADDDTVIESKHFIICNTNEYDKESNTYVGDLYSGLNYGSECSYLYTSINELYKCKLDTYDEIHSFLTHVTDAFPNTKICINYTNCYGNDNDSEIDIDIINSINDLLGLTDIYVFEHKEINDYFSLIKTVNEHNSNVIRTYMSSNNSNSRKHNNNTNERVVKINVEDVFIKEIHNTTTTKKVKAIKIGIFINEMKTISIIQQDPLSKLIMFHSTYDINYLPLYINDNDKNEYKNILLTHYDIIKSVFIGGFLSRLFNNKSFQTCYIAANESVKRIIDILRFNLTFSIEPSYYIITVKKPKQQQQQQRSKQSTANYQKESHFILDCTNVLSSRKKEYNSLYDHMCSSYFSNINTRKHLHKLGFINKRGVILHDPDKKYFGRSIRNKLLMSNYEKEKNELEKRKENNEIMKLQLKNIAKNKVDEWYKYKNVNELMEMSAVFNFEKTAYRKLPSITVKTKGKGKECGNKYNTDLYFKEIKHSRFLPKNNSSHSFCKLANVKARYLNRNASCDDKRSSSNKYNKEYVYYEKESVESNSNKGSDIEVVEVEEYVNKDKFLNLLNTYEEKLKRDTFNKGGNNNNNKV